MPISIDWGTRVIFVPQADLTPLGGNVYELDVDDFRLALKDLEDSEEGMSFPYTHNHNTEITLAGVTYARTIEIVNGYTVTFEDGQYAVNLVGANNNLADVMNVNQVSLRSFNSAGLVSQAALEEAAAALQVQVTALQAQATALQNATTTIDDRVSEVRALHGLTPGTPLIVTPTSRSAGGISQTITTVGDTVTVERT
jgi:hypothetical protein